MASDNNDREEQTSTENGDTPEKAGNGRMPRVSSIAPHRQPIEHRLSSATRRRFIKLLSGIGISYSALMSGLSKEEVLAASPNPKEEISYTAGYEVQNPEALGNPNKETQLEPQVDTVPRSTWKQIKSAQIVSNKLEKNLSEEFDSQSIGVGVHTERRRSGKRVTALVTKFNLEESQEGKRRSRGAAGPGQPNGRGPSIDEIRSKLPVKAQASIGKRQHEEMLSVPVNFQEVEVEYTGFGGKRRPVPGGVTIRGYHDGDNCSWDSAVQGTSTQPIYNTQSSSHEILTAGHVLSGTGGGNCVGFANKVYQAAKKSSHQIGGLGIVPHTNNTDKSDDLDGDGDTDEYIVSDKDYGTATCSPDVEYKIGGNASIWGAGSLQISGYKSNWEINMIEYNNETIYGQGSTTGRDSGEIIAFNSSDDWLATNKTGKGGDSGGPFFVKENGDAKMVGLLATSLELGNQGPIASPDGSAGNTIDGILSSNSKLQFDS